MRPHDHDAYLYCTQVLTDGSPNTYVSSCQANSFRLSDPGQSDDATFHAAAGGTSFAAPEFAGLLAIIEQKMASGGGLGNINPSLYTLAANCDHLCFGLSRHHDREQPGALHHRFAQLPHRVPIL